MLQFYLCTSHQKIINKISLFLVFVPLFRTSYVEARGGDVRRLEGEGRGGGGAERGGVYLEDIVQDTIILNGGGVG